MSSPGGGQPEIGELLRALGREALIREAENAGLRPRNGRMKCPWCTDKALEHRRDTVTIYPGKRDEPRIKCHLCGQSGTLVDVLAALNGWTDAQAIAHLRGLPAPAPKPALHLVQPEAAPPADKLTPEQVRGVWERLAKDDPEGRGYLEGRGLGEAVEMGLVRFASADHPDARVKAWRRDRRLVVALLKDVVGNHRGLQGRLTRPLKVGERGKCISFKATSSKRAFFGSPELIESSPVIAVAEGLPDFLALAGWTRGRDIVAVGAAGLDGLHTLAEELKRCGVPVEGRVFVLFPQNDRPLNKSRAAFERLGQLLHREGARVVMVSTQEDVKDLADWLQAAPDLSWPPPALAEALCGEPGDPDAGPALVEPSRGGLPISERITVPSFGQNFSTLVALLDDPLHREAIMGRRGELALNEMSGELDFDGRELDDTDVTGIRLRIELHAKTADGRTLKFSPQDIWDALTYLSKRRKVHPVRDWLRSLQWDGVKRLEPELAKAFGYEDPACLESVMLEKWFLAAVARGLEPGCKMDTVLVLMGLEGKRKTTLFEMLATRKLFTSSPVHIGEADGFAVLRRKWIIEWGELDSMRRARDQQSIKAFLSSAEDFYRPKWGRGHIAVPRSCVIVGTTNEEQFLQEAQGNRRFWPVKVLKLDFDWLKANREQLFAEAVGVFYAAASCEACRAVLPDSRCSFHRWWLPDEHEELLRQHNRGFQEQDEWVNLLADHIREKRPEKLSVTEVLEQVVKKPAGQWSPRDPNRAVEAIKALGWVKSSRRRIDGQTGRFWVPAAKAQLEMEGVDP